MKPGRTAVSFFALLVASACASSQAEPNRPTASAPGWPEAWDADRRPQADLVAPPPAYSPYGVELVSGDSRSLPTFYANGRAYVMGEIGERYRIRVTNPTSRRVEAVVSVDGLDAIEGKTASYEDKRGYVILPYGDVTIEGFRTSVDQVATFRFSSVRDSYAGRKGQDRNVGVIGVAFFPERDRPVRLPSRPVIPDERPRSSADAAPPAKASSYRGEGSSGAQAEARPSPSTNRPGLGTEFGEQRYSSVHYTSFQRESLAQPSAIVELRYNDREGLLALGLPLERVPPSDLSQRETADPFPKNRFATPPPR